MAVDEATRTETWYTWKVPVDDLDDPVYPSRLLTPHADPYVYESPFDLLFETPEDAFDVLHEYEYEDEAAEEGWLLCKETLEVCEDQPLKGADDG